MMGILNVTPDSFSDGGRFIDAGAARSHVESMIAGGASLIDIGGESTRPGSKRVSATQQIDRVVPALKACRDLPVTFSIDTMLTEVAAAALDAGAAVVNDISAGRQDVAMADFVARRGCPVVLMHVLGRIETMQVNPTYDDVVTEVRLFLQDATTRFERAGVAADRIVVDPGYGFGKNFEHNLSLLRGLRTIVGDGRPVLVGVSRKSFVGRLTGKSVPKDRVFGTAGAVAWCVAAGAAIVRVHDIQEMADVVAVVDAIRSDSAVGP